MVANVYKTQPNDIKLIISPGFGAGWSTWNDQHLKDFLLFDPGLIKLAENSEGVKAVKAYINEVFNGEPPEVYLGGWRDTRVITLPRSITFEICVYDGDESVLYEALMCRTPDTQPTTKQLISKIK